jgi:hypothetical protein
MSKTMTKFIVLFACCISLCLAGAKPGHAQAAFFLPAEAGQGIIFKSGVDPYTFSAQLHPSLGFGGDPSKFAIGASLAGVYANPDWAFLWGGRLTFHLTRLQVKPITAGPSISYGTIQFVASVLMESAELRRLAGGFTFDIWEGALQISPRAGYDYKQERPFLEVALGIDLISH